MAGNTSDWTRADVDRLYPTMPLVAEAVWENIEKARASIPQAPIPSPLRWHWEARADGLQIRTCSDCGKEVWVFEEGAICSGCKKESSEL